MTESDQPEYTGAVLNHFTNLWRRPLSSKSRTGLWLFWAEEMFGKSKDDVSGNVARLLVREIDSGIYLKKITRVP